MHIESRSIFVHLSRRELLVIEIERELKVHCLDGSLWITQHMVNADIVVEAGQSLVLKRPGAVVLQALKAGKMLLTVQEATPNPIHREVGTTCSSPRAVPLISAA